MSVKPVEPQMKVQRFALLQAHGVGSSDVAKVRHDVIGSGWQRHVEQRTRSRDGEHRLPLDVVYLQLQRQARAQAVGRRVYRAQGAKRKSKQSTRAVWTIGVDHQTRVSRRVDVHAMTPADDG